MAVVSDSPFAILTAVVAPAMLTNACSVLALGTGNRIARVVDRTRVVTGARASLASGSADYQGYTRQLERLQMRGKLLLKALQLFYASLGAFAASALAAIVGSALTSYDLSTAFEVAAIIGFIIGAGGVSGLVIGCTFMVKETRLAIQNMAQEVDFARTHQGEVRS
jgi:hypothetical protein